MRRLQPLLLSATVSILTFAGISASDAATPSTRAEAHKLAFAAKAFVLGVHSFHGAITGTVNGVSINEHITFGAQSTQQSFVTNNGLSFNIVYVDATKTLYLKANAASLENTYGVTVSSAATEANRWFILPHNNSNYASAVSGLTLATSTEGMDFGAFTSVGPVTTFHGAHVIELLGKVAASANGPAGNVTLYVTAGLPTKPVAMTQSIASQGSYNLAWSGFNTKVSIATPATTSTLTN